MKHKKLISFSVIIIALTMLCGVIVLGYIYYEKNFNKPKELTNKGTTIIYKDGNLTRGTLNDDYKNSLFPDIRIPVEGMKAEVVENDRNADGIINFMTTLKVDKVNLNLTMYSDNNGRNAGVICFENGDYQDIGNGWSREKLKSQNGVQVGYYYVKNPSYIKIDDNQFNSIYRKYKQFKDDNKQLPLEKDKIVSCDYAQRVNETKTILKQKNGSDKVFFRIMVDSVPKLEDLNLLDKIITKTKL